MSVSECAGKAQEAQSRLNSRVEIMLQNASKITVANYPLVALVHSAVASDPTTSICAKGSSTWNLVLIHGIKAPQNGFESGWRKIATRAKKRV